MRDYLTVVAEYRQAILAAEEAVKAWDQASGTMEVMRARSDAADITVSRLQHELVESAKASAT